MAGEEVIDVLGFADTVSGHGSVTTPAANATIAGTIAVPAGVYEVELIYAITAVAEALPVNLRLFAGVTEVGRVPTALALGSPAIVTFRRATMAASNPFLLQAIALATTGSIYTAAVRATRLQ